MSCNQLDSDGCATDPELGSCPACGYVFHDLPRHTDDAHGELCCGSAAACTAEGRDICSTHDTYPA